MKKISVIIPVYNSEKTIEKTLISIQNQSIKDIEILVIDDGSTDHSKKIICEKMKEDSRIKYLYQKNSGAGFARNNGIKQASGKYIAFMDADDCYPNDGVLEKLYNISEQSNVNICGGYISFTDYQKETTTNFHRIEKNGIILFEDYQKISGFTRFLYKRSFLIDNQLFFPKYSVYEDPVFLLKVMVCEKKFFSINECTYCHLGTHQSNEMTLEKTKDYLKGLKEVLQISSDNNLQVLYKDTVDTIIRKANYYVECNLISCDEELLLLLMEINTLLNYKLSNEKEYFVLPIFTLILKTSKKYYKLSRYKIILFLKKLIK